MHAAALAKSVGIPTVLVPEQPGVLSAVGLVMADIRHDFVQTRVMRGKDIEAYIGSLFEELEQLGAAALAQDGIAPESRVLQRTADLRYVGQAYEVNVSVADGKLDAKAIKESFQRFHQLHKQFYAHNHPDKPIEFVSGRVTALGLVQAPPIRRRERGSTEATRTGSYRVYFEETGGFVDAAVYDRDALGPGCRFEGPAVVEQLDTTTIIHPGQTAGVDDHGNLLITTGADAHAG
jgi:N-methylhydantoinase A